MAENKELVVRWKYQCQQLANYLKANNEVGVEAARARINSIAAQAETEGVVLPPAAGIKGAEGAADDPVFEGLESIFAPAVKVGTAPAPPAEVTSGPGAAVAQAPVRAAKSKKAALVAAVAPVPPIETPVAVSHRPCACGCGTTVPGHTTFAKGHVARYHSLIRQVETGKLPVENLPGLMRAELQWSKDGLVTNAKCEIKRGGAVAASVLGSRGKRAPRVSAPALGAAGTPLSALEQQIAHHTRELGRLKELHAGMKAELAGVHAKWAARIKNGAVVRKRARKPLAVVPPAPVLADTGA